MASLGKTISAYLGLAVIFAFAIMSGHSIKCWVCRSDGDPKCADPFDNRSFPITDCRHAPQRAHLPGLESTMCRKVRQKGEQGPEYRSQNIETEYRAQNTQNTEYQVLQSIAGQAGR